MKTVISPFAVKKIADGCDPTLGWNVVLNAQRRVCLDFNGNVVRVFINDKEAFDAIEDPNVPATFLWLKNKGRSGIDIHNNGTETILRCRTSTEIRTEIPIQEPVEEEETLDSDLKRLQELIEAGEGAEAFFLARSLLTSGESWAAEWMEKAKELL